VPRPIDVILAAFTGTIPVNVDTVVHGAQVAGPRLTLGAQALRLSFGFVPNLLQACQGQQLVDLVDLLAERHDRIGRAAGVGPGRARSPTVSWSLSPSATSASAFAYTTPARER
jgi:hypothetical protein